MSLVLMLLPVFFCLSSLVVFCFVSCGVVSIKYRFCLWHSFEVLFLGRSFLLLRFAGIFG